MSQFLNEDELEMQFEIMRQNGCLGAAIKLNNHIAALDELVESLKKGLAAEITYTRSLSHSDVTRALNNYDAYQKAKEASK